jgi:hypothetical protein
MKLSKVIVLLSVMMMEYTTVPKQSQENELIREKLRLAFVVVN